MTLRATPSLAPSVPSSAPSSLGSARPDVLLGHLVLAALAVALLAFAGGVLAVGLTSGYYQTAFEGRPDHPLHDVLRPGGSVGVLLGTTGTALMLGMQLYTARKWLPLRWPIGSPSWWLRFHILCGLLGPVLIVLHGGLYAPSGLVAVAFWCMLLVSLSGTFGRYVYGYFPRTAAGSELTLRSAAARLSELRSELVELTGGADADRIGEAVALARDLDAETHNLWDLVVLDLEVRRRARRIRRLLSEADRGSAGGGSDGSPGSGLSAEVREAAVRRLVDQLELRRGMHGWQVTQRLFRYWHLFHEPLAQAMYIIVAWHVFTAIVFGGALETLLRWVS